MRQPARLVQLNDIISTEILGDDPEVLSLVMRIHLALEAILIEVIKNIKTDDSIYRLPFPQKTKFLLEKGIIRQGLADAFNRLNDFRNDFAHIFGHRITLADALKLARDLEGFGVDFSDSAGHYSEAEATEYYDGLMGILAEVGWCILFEAAFILEAAGGRDIFR